MHLGGIIDSIRMIKMLKIIKRDDVDDGIVKNSMHPSSNDLKMFQGSKDGV
jgi:hypothetical protein